jgi:hypothetical protein
MKKYIHAMEENGFQDNFKKFTNFILICKEYLGRIVYQKMFHPVRNVTG